MFMTNVFAGASRQNLDPQEWRDPPPQATPVTFPEARTFVNRAWNGSSPPPKLQPLFARILRPSDLSDNHADALNIQASYACPPEELIPLAPDGSSYIPSLAPNQSVNVASYSDAVKVDIPLDKRRPEFDERLAELRIDNDTGYRVITRTTKPGDKPPRLAYMRKFWEGLESVAQYWDVELDQYHEDPPPRPDIDGEQEAKRQRLEPTSNGPSILTLQTAPPNENNIGDPPTPFPGDGEPMAADEKIPLPDKTSDSHCNGSEHDTARNARSASATPELTPEPWSSLLYKGRRTASGRDMPDQFRVDTVKAFVEGTVWPFQATVAPPRQMPMIQINKLNLPVRQTAAVYRLPKGLQQLRQGWLKGPMLSIQIRPETDFDAAILSEQQSETKCRLDAMRELGGLLQLAQERQRQGKTEARAGEGKWWTCKPRWGGGHGGEVEKAEGNGDVKDVVELAEEMAEVAAKKKPANKRPKRKTPAMLWKELKPGSKTWDPKMEYEAIGKEPGSDYDEVFLVSSLNHHISILKLTVHAAYVEYIRSETMPSPPPSDANWCIPKLQRTRWYDLLNVEDRVEAFRALWGVMAYLSREMPTSPPGPAAAAAEAKLGAADDARMRGL